MARGLFAVILLLFLGSCRKDKEAPVEVGHDYFPLEEGHYVEYDVDSMYYHNNINDTLDSTVHVRYRLKILVESSFTDNSGRDSRRLELHKKYYDPSVPYDLQQYQIAEVQSVTLTQRTLEWKEGNTTFLKLIFPVAQGKKWNGNAFNIQDEWDYEYASAHDPYSYGSFSFDSSLTVIQTGLNDPLIHTQLGTEVYAKHAGLVYRDLKVVEHLPDTSGFHLTMTLVNYKKP